MDHKTELLLPAGSLERLKVAVLYGADAIYMGTPDLSLRTRSVLTLEDVREGIAFAHAQGKKVYLTLNLFSHNRDLPKLPAFIDTIRDIRPDGVIVADIGVFDLVREHLPAIEIHISTQANVCSWLSVQAWQKKGASLVVLAREVSFEELKEIRERCPDIKLEVFAHGAMCMTYSGRCLLSNFLAERGANQGNCANSCRWHYKLHVRRKDGSLHEVEVTEENKDVFAFFLQEEQRPDDFLEIQEDERGSYILNSKDLCLMPVLDQYLALGVDSLKIEGRNRSAYYTAVTAQAYRRAIDAWRRNPDGWSPDSYMRELRLIPNRGYTQAFHAGKLTHHAHNYEDTHTLAPWEYAGIIRQVGADAFFMEVKNRIEQGEVLEFMAPDGGPSVLLRIYTFEDVQNRRTTAEEGINAGQKPLIRIPFAWFHEEEPATLMARFPAFTIVRKAAVLGDESVERLKLDRIAQAAERGEDNEAAYQQQRDKTVQGLEAAKEGKTFRAPKLGAEGCCGRGCNGCLHFWHDEKFAKAREKLRTKKQGELLSSTD
ncbi:MAG: U32 family peptidase [Alphaproteobacteria bacterium]|nr:U32 family peptidase [Alphaproteobacteria bacterium]